MDQSHINIHLHDDNLPGIAHIRVPFGTYHHLSEEQAPPRAIHAFATLLTGEGDVEMTVDYPYYFTAVRLLTYQLLHNPRTRGRGEIPFVVPATKDVPQEQLDTLTQDGAMVIPVEGLHSTWIHPKWERRNDVLAELHLWKLTE